MLLSLFFAISTATQPLDYANTQIYATNSEGICIPAVVLASEGSNEEFLYKNVNIIDTFNYEDPVFELGDTLNLKPTNAPGVYALKTIASSHEENQHLYGNLGEYIFQYKENGVYYFLKK